MKSYRYSHIVITGALTFGVNLILSAVSQYPLFRDELYYIACANNISYGYVDHPPFSIWVLHIWKSIFGDGLFSIRLAASLVSAATIASVSHLTIKLGGTVKQAYIASAIFGLSPVTLGFSGIYTMNIFDLLFWSLCFNFFLNLLLTGNRNYWYVTGVLLGIGAMNKTSMIWLGIGLAVGVLLTKEREQLRNKEPWIAFALALLIFSPYIIWNSFHDFSHLEFMMNASGNKYSSQNPITFLSGLVLLMNPLAVPVWLGGFIFLLKEKTRRIIGIAVLTVLMVLLINFHSKSEYFTSAMTVIIPAGVVFWSRIFTNKRYIPFVYTAIIFLMGIVLLPVSRDILPVKQFMKYQKLIGLEPPSTEGHEMGALPQHFADRFGWEKMAEQISKIYSSLPDYEKYNTYFYGRNYGEAAAIDYYKRTYSLPPAISQHNSYYLWSWKYLNQDMTIIIIGVDPKDLQKDFEEITLVGFHSAEFAMPYENNLKIFLCRKLRNKIDTVWRNGKIYI